MEETNLNNAKCDTSVPSSLSAHAPVNTTFIARIPVSALNSEFSSYSLNIEEIFREFTVGVLYSDIKTFFYFIYVEITESNLP